MYIVRHLLQTQQVFVDNPITDDVISIIVQPGQEFEIIGSIQTFTNIVNNSTDENGGVSVIPSVSANTLVIPNDQDIIIEMNGIQTTYTSQELFDNPVFRELFNFSAFTSGDPHVYPIFGSPFELPTKPNIFRMLQGQQLCINASTRYMTSSESRDIETFYKLINKTQHVPSNLQTNGTFYKTLRIVSNNNVCIVHFTPDNIKIENKNTDYFKTKRETPDSPYILKKESEIITDTITISFYNIFHGLLEIQVRTFLNPQTKYGFTLMCQNKSISNLSGLLVREYKLKSMSLNNINNEKPLSGRIQINKKITKQITQSI